MTAYPAAKFKALRVRAIDLDLQQRPLETSAGTYARFPLLLLDIVTSLGVVGHSYTGCFLAEVRKGIAAVLDDLSVYLSGETLSPLGLSHKLRGITRLAGLEGIVGTAIAMIEVAAWDALAKQAELPLFSLLGAVPRAIPIYKTIVAMDPVHAAELAAEARQIGYGGVKCKLGRAGLRDDISMVEAVRAACGDDFPVMADYNQILSLGEALRRVPALEAWGLTWIEEPIAASDNEGHSRIRRSTRTPISIGENWSSSRSGQDSLRAEACDYAMPDLIRVGGVAEWLKTAILAEASGVPVSSHIFPEICAHLMCTLTSPHWLEHVGLADHLFRTPIVPVEGRVTASDAPGIGIEWNEDAVQRASV